jgi:hypothetical protein
MWAFWGTIEAFHEGWYQPTLAGNVWFSLTHYLPWMFLPMLAGLAALWRRWAGWLAHGVLVVVVLGLFGVRWSAGTVLIGVPLLLLAVLYTFGRPVPVAWARRMLVIVPIATALVAGVVPGWRALTRPAGVNLSMTRIAGAGVDLVWAPAGPGWSDTGFSWFEARRRCEHLVADGSALADRPQGVWRLPTVDEAVRTMIWRGANAGGSWDAVARLATYRRMPDKEAPLWNPLSQVIYWWTADELDADRAFRIVYNGQVHAMPKRWGPAYMACRCVKPA